MYIITGSTGLIGSSATEFFLKKNIQIIGIDNDLRTYFFGKVGSNKWKEKKLKKYKLYNHFNIDIFERAGLLSLPMKLSFSPFGIDPYYTRFSSNFNLRLSDGTTYEGTGVMEIMDLH